MRKLTGFYVATIVQWYDARLWALKRGFDSRWSPMRKKKVYLRRLLRTQPSRTMNIGYSLPLGDFGIVSSESGFLSRNQRESVRKLLARRLKPVNGKYWVNINYFIDFTKKSRGARMGKGKGSFFSEKSPVRPGQLLCEFKGIDAESARELYSSLSKKLPVNTLFFLNRL